MKKIILMHAIMSMCAALIIQSASSQTIIGFAKVEMRTPDLTKQKEEVAAAANTGKNYINIISIKAMRAFVKNFKNAENVSWRITNDGGYVAQFKSDSVQTIVRYAANGSCNYMLKKYAEKQMTPDLRTLVKSIYFD